MEMNAYAASIITGMFLLCLITTWLSKNSRASVLFMALNAMLVGHMAVSSFLTGALVQVCFALGVAIVHVLFIHILNRSIHPIDWVMLAALVPVSSGYQWVLPGMLAIICIRWVWLSATQFANVVGVLALFWLGIGCSLALMIRGMVGPADYALVSLVFFVMLYAYQRFQFRFIVSVAFVKLVGLIGLFILAFGGGAYALATIPSDLAEEGVVFGFFLLMVVYAFFRVPYQKKIIQVWNSGNYSFKCAYETLNQDLLNVKTLAHVLLSFQQFFNALGAHSCHGAIIQLNGSWVYSDGTLPSPANTLHETNGRQQNGALVISRDANGVALSIQLVRNDFFYGWLHVMFPNHQYHWLLGQQRAITQLVDHSLNAIQFMFLCDELNINIKYLTNANEFISRALLETEGDMISKILNQFKETMGFTAIILPKLTHYGSDWLISDDHVSHELMQQVQGLTIDCLFESPYDPIHVHPSDPLYSEFEFIIHHVNAHDCYLLPIVQHEFLHGVAIGFCNPEHDTIDMNLLSIVSRQVSSILCRSIVNTKIIQTKQRYQDIIDHLSSIIVVVNTDFEIQFSNQYFKTFFGKHYASFHELTKDYQNLDVVHKIKDYSDTELTIELKEHHFKVSLRYLMNDTIIVLLTNVTDLVNIQASISTSSKLKGIGTFVAGVAHEIKNPLVAVKTFTQLICKDWKNQDIRDKCKNIVLPQLNRIRRLAQSLDYSDWVEKSTFEPLDLSIILNNTKEWLAIDSRLDSRVSMSFSIEPNMMVFANQMALEQVFINLALNAMDAVRNTERPAIGFRMQSNELTKVVVDVEDNGGGISHHHQQQLFDPFFTTKDDGTGLGLSIVHQIMADHQGRIFLLKSDENGSTFRLVFPKLLRPKIRGKVT